jgi:hypothetical protein
MLLFLIKKKWNIFFSINQNGSNLIIQFFLLLIVILISCLFTSVFDFFIQNKNVQKLDYTTKVLNIFLLLFPAFIKFFPSIAQKMRVVQKHYPLTRIQIVFFELMYSVFTKTWIFYMFIFCNIIYFSSTCFNFYQYLALIFLGINGVLLAENLIEAFYSKFKSYKVLVLLFAAVTAFIYNSHFIDNFYYESITFGIIFLLIIYFTFYSTETVISSISTRDIIFGSKNVVLKILLRNNKFMSTILFSLTMQSIFVFLIFEYIVNDLPIIKYYAFSFIIIFSYCYNNIWGFFPKVALNLYVTGCSIKKYLVLYIQLFIPSFIFSVIIFCIILISYPYFISLKFLLGFLCLSLFIIVNGMIFSFLRMKKVSTSISFINNSNTSLIPMYVFGVLSIGLGLSEFNDTIFYLYLCLLLFISIIGFKFIYLKRYYLFAKLIERII